MATRDNLPGEERHPQRRAFRKALSASLKRARRKEAKLEAEIAEAASAAQWLECGEILKAHLGSLHRGMTEVELPDLYHPGAARTIALEARLRPLDNAKKYFRKHRKLVRSSAAKERELRLCREELDQLASLKERYDQWDRETDPARPPSEPLVAEAALQRVVIKALCSVEEAAPRSAGQVKGVRIFTSREGLPIWVGKAARDNDRLSLQLAKGNDWWFHAAGYTGSHVVVRMGSAKSPLGKMANKKRRKDSQACPQETLLDAAHLAVWFSKVRNATRVEIHYTQAKHVRKRKGAPAGQVTLREYQTLLLRVEQTRLDRLLERHT